MNNMPLITDANNRFFAGMTLQQAKINGTDKSWWHRDFHNLDKDKNGVLSVDEVMNERKCSSTRNKIGAVLCAGLIPLELFMVKGSKGWLRVDSLIDVVIGGALTIGCIGKAIKTDKQTKEYEEIIRNQHINRYA